MTTSTRGRAEVRESHPGYLHGPGEQELVSDVCMGVGVEVGIDGEDWPRPTSSCWEEIGQRNSNS